MSAASCRVLGGFGLFHPEQVAVIGWVAKIRQ